MLKEMIDWKRAAIAAAIVVVVIVAIILIANSGKPTPADTPYQKEGRMIVGVTADTAFAYQNEEGNPEGYEIDVIDEILTRIYGEEFLVEYHTLNSQQVSYKLKNDVIDCALAMLPSDVTKTRGLLISDPYYEDTAACFIQPGSAASIDNLKGKTIGVITTAISSSKIESALTEAGFTEEEIDIRACTSYPDAWESLRTGELAALIIPSHYVTEEQTQEFEVLSTEDVFQSVGYHIALWTDDSNLQELINEQIREMTEDGSLRALQEKWGLES